MTELIKSAFIVTFNTVILLAEYLALLLQFKVVISTSQKVTVFAD